MSHDFSRYLTKAQQAYREGRADVALVLLEQAHIVGQPVFRQHWLSHWWMLKAGWHLGDSREVAGQLLRLALTPLGHLTGRLPAGNTGRARVNPFKPMP
ncbi:DUF3703 domain-containing protein [Chitinimonas sp. BJYL2]|uniref:DUF3703 domain-containing protein n=1 Tax=Chitinimonas sp. BJYL2 TaxID=2976696 RepID=UPI0022B38850|nr:DUF3703 domain-containing protein [Chitinimonas sp. BJYL2]